MGGGGVGGCWTNINPLESLNIFTYVLIDKTGPFLKMIIILRSQDIIWIISYYFRLYMLYRVILFQSKKDGQILN